MDTAGPGLLGQTQNRVFHIGLGHHHQVAHLVDDDNNIRHFFFSLGIIGFDIPYAGIREGFIAPFHFRYGPVQCRGRFFGIRNHRHQQMGNAIVIGQFHHLGVNQDQFHLVRTGFVHDAGQQRIYTDGLTAAGSARYQQVGHLCKVDGNYLAFYIFAKPDT